MDKKKRDLFSWEKILSLTQRLGEKDGDYFVYGSGPYMFKSRVKKKDNLTEEITVEVFRGDDLEYRVNIEETNGGHCYYGYHLDEAMNHFWALIDTDNKMYRQLMSLQGQEQPKPEDVIGALSYFAKNKKTILYQFIEHIVTKSDMNADQLRETRDALSEGARYWRSVGRRDNSEEYSLGASHCEDLIKEKGD